MLFVTILSVLFGLGSLVCWIMVLIKMFPAEGPLKGILAIICALYAFIWGWQKNEEQDLKNVMIAWSIIVVGNVILGSLSNMMQN